MTVDRKNRDLLIAAINRYIDGETTAFKFDDEIFGIKSDDPTISYAVFQLWHFYPPGMKPFKIRSPLMDFAVTLQCCAVWAIFSPLVLLFQVLPTTETDTRIVMD